ncbi:MAG: hypothetical protein JKP98_19695 [Rhodobacteraceae bacterium]|nr:hypothetical protein [Paracoccaceae bacterium]
MLFTGHNLVVPKARLRRDIDHDAFLVIHRRVLAGWPQRRLRRRCRRQRFLEPVAQPLATRIRIRAAKAS